jgi:uncharacterized membrane protein YdjX (TVP38/TMEM64 family)
MKIKVVTGNKKLIFYLSLLVLLSLIIYRLGLTITSGKVADFVKKAGAWGPIVFIFIMTLTYIIAPLSGTPAFFAGFMLFKNRVQIYNYLAVLLAATLNFWIARRWGRGLVSRFVGRKNIERIDQFTKDYGARSLILLRLFQGHLHDFISYAYGLTNMSYFSFIFISALAPIPWLLLWQFYIFKRVENIGEFTIWFVATLAPFLVISGFFASKFRKR